MCSRIFPLDASILLVYHKTMVNDKVVQTAVKTLLQAVSGSKVILFGSHARGDARPDSDVDLLVVEPDLQDRFKETVRLNKLLGDMLIPADVLVVSNEAFEQWRDVPNTVVYRAVREGRVYE